MNLPSKFGMVYTGADGKEHTPIMLHRTIFGAMERFCAILIEHYAGAFPSWIAPEQVRLINVADKHKEYVMELERELRDEDVRVGIDASSDTLNYKIKKATKEKIPYIAVIGDKEIESKMLNIRERGGEKTREVSKEEFIKEIKYH
jgi:threonyl-tRNA synthetase